MSSSLADVATIYSQDTNLKKEDVDQIFGWLQTQTHLPQLTELQVILFLHSCVYNSEQTKVTIEKYFTLRTNSDLFKSGNEEFVRRVLQSFFVGILPKKTPEGYVVWLFKIFDPSSEKFVSPDICKLVVMNLSLYFHQNGPSNGLILLGDMKDIGFGHLLKMNVLAVSQIFQFLQDAAPTRIKGIHFINAVPATKHLIALCKPFMKKEVYAVLKTHPGSFNSLYEFVPKTCLAEEHGGHLGPILQIHEENRENILEHLDFFQWHDAQVVDESKRKQKKGKRLLGFLK